MVPLAFLPARQKKKSRILFYHATARLDHGAIGFLASSPEEESLFLFYHATAIFRTALKISHAPPLQVT
jgi:hypothetical protein